MRAGNQPEHGRRVAIYLLAVFIVVVVLGVAIGLIGSIDHKLKQSAEQQAITFTEQTAGNVADRAYIVQQAIGAFEVQSTDPAMVVPALAGMTERFGLAGAAFTGMDGEGLDESGKPFSVSQLTQPETALSRAEESYSNTFQLEDGRHVRMAQRPLYINGQQVGALFVQIPLSLFSMPVDLDMFDGRGYFLLFDSASGEILVKPTDRTDVPVEDGETIYGFLEKSSQPTDFEGMPAGGGLEALRTAVASGQTGLGVSLIDGKQSYVCVAPVGRGSWSVCNIVPVANVRAEASSVLMAFQAIFVMVVLCFAGVLVITLNAYRKSLTERTVSMKARLFKALSDSLDMAVNLYCPDDKTITPIVAKAARITGYSMPELMSDPSVPDNLQLSDEGRTLLQRLRAGQQNEIAHGTFSFTNQGTGEPRWTSYATTPLCYDGKSQVLVALQDVTTEKELEESMKDAMMAAEAANQAKSEFLSRMSHEMRTPLNAIFGMQQVMRMHPGDVEKVDASLYKIGLASDQLLNLINDVLDIAKIESGKMTLSSEPFRLSHLEEHAIAVIGPQCEQKGQTFEVNAAQDEEVFVGDFQRLCQMLINLLTNSVKYTDEGGSIRLTVSVRPVSTALYRCVTFVVADTGIGMSDEFKEHLFEPFMMEGRSNAQGTGLGMPIVKNIVAMMGGYIHVDTAMGQGTTFTIAVNLRVALDSERLEFEQAERVKAEEEAAARGEDAAPDEGAGESAAAGDGAAALPSSAPPDEVRRLASHRLPDHRLGMGSTGTGTSASAAYADEELLCGARILLAEDNDLNAEIACELLGARGLLLERAQNGQEACDMFDRSPIDYYDAVLMDVQMPLLNGYEATRSIRALPRPDATTVPIVAMSANAFAEDERASAESGMNAHLSKPINVGKVISCLAREVRSRRAGGRGATGGDAEAVE